MMYFLEQKKPANQCCVLHSKYMFRSAPFDFILIFSSDRNKIQLGDNGIQNFHLGRYIVGYTVGNLVLRVAVKLNFRPYIRRYTSPNENFEYGYPHSNALLFFSLKKTVKTPIRPAAASCIKPLASCIYSLVSQ